MCNIVPPNFGYKQHELMQDIALSVGAKYFSEKTGDNLNLVTMDDLGHADKVIAGKTQTVIIKNNQMTEAIQTRIEELKEQQSNTDIVSDRDFITERIASLSGSIGAIYVGGNSDVEQKEKYDRVEDAVCAVRSALEEGIVKGGGVALMQCHDMLYHEHSEADNIDDQAAIHILQSACLEPAHQILVNAGKSLEEIYHSKDGEDYDVKNEVYGDMYEMGIIDPLKVTKNAFENAVSVATTILTTNAIVTHARAVEL
jgi:chaperonin GroEL